MKDKRILITGGAGSIGSELVRQLYKTNKLYVVDNNETALFDLVSELNIAGRVGDVTDPHTIRDIYSDFKPQAVFHAAARKHVTPMEQQPLEAINTNVLGLYQVLYYSKVYPVEKFVFISTDKAVDPDSIMGATKRLGEIMVKNSGKGYVAVRFGNVLGSRGSLIPIWEKQMNQGKPITVTDERMTRFFMTIDQACELVIKAADEGEGGETFVLDMGKQINILDLAKELVAKNKYQPGDRNPNVMPPDPIAITGIRPGEKLSEKLMTEEEEKRAIKKDKFFIFK